MGKTRLCGRHSSLVEHVGKSEFLFDVCLSLCVDRHDVKRVTEYMIDCSLIWLAGVLDGMSDDSSDWISWIVGRVKDDTRLCMCQVVADNHGSKMKSDVSVFASDDGCVAQGMWNGLRKTKWECWMSWRDKDEDAVVRRRRGRRRVLLMIEDKLTVMQRETWGCRGLVQR